MISTPKKYCTKCRHYAPPTYGFIYFEEFCRASPADTYAAPRSSYANPRTKNRKNDCEDWEAL